MSSECGHDRGGVAVGTAYFDEAQARVFFEELTLPVLVVDQGTGEIRYLNTVALNRKFLELMEFPEDPF